MKALALALALSLNGSTPGEIVIMGDAGITLSTVPKLRLSVGVEWLPFRDDSWGGLNEIGFGSNLFLTAASEGNAAWQFCVGYGRPNNGLWGNFEAGYAVVVGWTAGEIEVFPYAPTASLRLGFGPIALRVLGFIVGGNRGVFHLDHYALTLEGMWGI